MLEDVLLDYSEAFEWYRKAAEHGNASAQYRLGEIYFNGFGVERNIAEAKKWFLSAAELGNADAQFTIGWMNQTGYGLPQDFEEALKWYSLAAAQGNVSAQCNLANMYYNGFGLKKDYAEAADWYRKAAEHGYSVAQFDLGFMYDSGRGVERDRAEASKWYSKSLEQNQESSQCKFKEQVFELFCKAQEQADAEARHSICKSIKNIIDRLKKNSRSHRAYSLSSDALRLPMALVIQTNPVMQADKTVRKEYISGLRAYLAERGWDNFNPVRVLFQTYESVVMSSGGTETEHGIDYYGLYLLLDVLYILEFTGVNPESAEWESLKEKLLEYAKGRHAESDYIELIIRNFKFNNIKPARIMITATMSAGKSTFVNALSGKYVSLSRNLACTSKIRYIVNKAYEDGWSYKYDDGLYVTQDQHELLEDCAENKSDSITAAINFHGMLSSERLVLIDSPGVNSSEHPEHRKITERMITGWEYELLVYIMNATQLRTDDDKDHLSYVKNHIGSRPAIFVLNFIDEIDPENEDLNEIITRQRRYLKDNGIENPIICPLSAKGGYFSKQFKEGALSRSQTRELYCLIDMMSRFDLPGYYESNFGIKISDFVTEEEQLQKTSGLLCVEKLILKLTRGHS